MHRRFLYAAFALVACRAESDQASRPLPAPEPPADTRSSPVEVTTAAVTERARERPSPAKDDDAVRAVEPERSEQAAAKADPAPADTAGAAPAAPTAAPAASVAAEAPAGGADVACHHACQAALQACLSAQPADPDGGTNLEGLATCKKALDACKVRCGS